MQVESTIEEYQILKALERRNLYLTRPILSVENEDLAFDQLSSVAQIIRCIIEFNAQDKGVDPKDRKPIKLFINSPGGDVYEGFSLGVCHRVVKNSGVHYQCRHMVVHGFLDWYYWAQALCFAVYDTPSSRRFNICRWLHQRRTRRYGF